MAVLPPIVAGSGYNATIKLRYAGNTAIALSSMVEGLRIYLDVKEPETGPEVGTVGPAGQETSLTGYQTKTKVFRTQVGNSFAFFIPFDMGTTKYNEIDAELDKMASLIDASFVLVP